jgi:hypothetical protein
MNILFKKIKTKYKDNVTIETMVLMAISLFWVPVFLFQGVKINNDLIEKEGRVDGLNGHQRILKLNTESKLEINKGDQSAQIENQTIYSNQIYGFKIKYPSSWPAPKEENPSAENQWIKKIIFKDSSPWEKFYLLVYKNSESKAEVDPISWGYENEKACSARKINIIKNYFNYKKENIYEFRKDDYVVKIFKGEGELNFSDSQFKSSALSFIFQKESIPISRKDHIAQTIVGAKKPYAYDVVAGKRVCNKKNDRPGKSDQHKGKHMDMECCLDPDEIPNPYCTYSNAKYQKLLAKLK